MSKSKNIFPLKKIFSLFLSLTMIGTYPTKSQEYINVDINDYISSPEGLVSVDNNNSYDPELISSTVDQNSHSNELIFSESASSGNKCAIAFSKSFFELDIFERSLQQSDFDKIEFFTGEAISGKKFYCDGKSPNFYPSDQKEITIRIFFSDSYLRSIGYSDDTIEKNRKKNRIFTIDIDGAVKNGRLHGEVILEEIYPWKGISLFKNGLLSGRNYKLTVYANEGIFYVKRSDYLKSFSSEKEKTLIKYFDYKFNVSAQKIGGSSGKRVPILGSIIGKNAAIVIEYEFRPKKENIKLLLNSSYVVNVVAEINYKETLAMKGLGSQTTNERHIERFSVLINRKDGYSAKGEKKFQIDAGSAFKILGFEGTFKRFGFSPNIYISKLDKK